MNYQVQDDDQNLLDAKLNLDSKGIDYLSRGGSIKSGAAINSDYGLGLRLILERIKKSNIKLSGIWVESSRVKNLPIEEREILSGEEFSQNSHHDVFTIISKRMISVGQLKKLKHGNSTKKIRIEFKENIPEHIARETLNLFNPKAETNQSGISALKPQKYIDQTSNNNKFAIAPTDLHWFRQLRNEGFNQSVVNFWTPTPWNVKGLKKGDPLFFMLKAPIRRIGGFGKFVNYKNMSATDAWNEYGINNGVKTLDSLQARMKFYKSKQRVLNTQENHIGCILLDQLELFDDDEFKEPENMLGVSFPTQVVKLKYFASTIQQNKIVKLKTPEIPSTFQAQKNSQKKITNVKITERKGQTKFRKDILNIYQYKCAISGVNEENALEAAHIEDYVNEKSNHIQNGLCLRSDIHKLFDRHLIGIDRNYKIHISSKIEDKEYRKFEGKIITVPKDEKFFPLKKLLEDRFRSYRK